MSLADYVGRMKEGQDAIYYITADGFAAARNSPHLEIFRKLGVEVLLMYDRDRRVGRVGADRVRRQAAAVGGARATSISSKLGGEAPKQEQETQARRVQAARGAHAGRR